MANSPISQEKGLSHGKRVIERESLAQNQEIGKRLGIPLLIQGPRGVFICEFIDREVAYSSRDLKGADVERRMKFGALMLDEGILIAPRGRWYVCGAITEADVDKTLDCADRVMGKL